MNRLQYLLIKLTGADGSPSIESLDTRPVSELIRTKQSHDLRMGKLPKGDYSVRYSEVKREEPKIQEPRTETCTPTRTHTFFETVRYRRKVFGDPWMIEDFNATLINGGNSGMQHYLNDTEELLLLEHANGAKGQLFDIPSIYFAETKHNYELAVA